MQTQQATERDRKGQGAVHRDKKGWEERGEETGITERG